MYNNIDTKECDILQITTVSIKNFVQDIFKKEPQNLLISEQLLIESLSISGKDFNNNKQEICFQDLKEFQNLKYLEVANTLLTSSAISILSKITYLENLFIRNCTFSSRLNNIDKLTNIKSIRIYNCKGFNPSYLSTLKNLKRICLSKIEIKDINIFSELTLNSLDVSSSSIENWIGIDKLNINTLIINKKQYIKNEKEITKCKFKIIIIATDGYYIEKWIN
ncbi:MAG: hypothetical protein HFJ38_03420 [Bacilli bacterium]|nr:hypothetical protein [Bacilli bacterium]